MGKKLLRKLSFLLTLVMVTTSLCMPAMAEKKSGAVSLMAIGDTFSDSSGFEFEVQEDGTVYVTGPQNIEKNNPVIPETATHTSGKAYDVTGIGRIAGDRFVFSMNDKLTGRLTINGGRGSDNTFKIMTGAFQYCTGLTSLYLGEYTENVLGNQFDGCYGLKKINFRSQQWNNGKFTIPDNEYDLTWYDAADPNKSPITEVPAGHIAFRNDYVPMENIKVVFNDWDDVDEDENPIWEPKEDYNQTVNETQCIEKPKNLVDTGSYHFVGWCTDTACKDVWDFNDSIDESLVKVEEGNYTFNLYAKWVEKEEEDEVYTDGQGIRYKVYGEDTLDIIGMEDGKTIKNPTIPRTIEFDGKKYTVNGVNKDAFRDCDRLVGRLIIEGGEENSYFRLNENAFMNCKKLTSLIIGPNTEKSIVDPQVDNPPFYGCSGITRITMYSNVWNDENSSSSDRGMFSIEEDLGGDGKEWEKATVPAGETIHREDYDENKPEFKVIFMNIKDGEGEKEWTEKVAEKTVKEGEKITPAEITVEYDGIEFKGWTLTPDGPQLFDFDKTPADGVYANKDDQIIFYARWVDKGSGEEENEGEVERTTWQDEWERAYYDADGKPVQYLGGTYEFPLEDKRPGTIELVKYKGSATEVTVPEYAGFRGVKFYPVVRNGGSLLQSDNKGTIQMVDLSNVDMSQATNFNSAFEGLTAVKKIIMGKGTTTASFTSATNMFEKCESLTEVDFKDLGFDHVQNVEAMFRYCKSMEKLDLSKLDFSNVTRAVNFMVGCDSLQEFISPKMSPTKTDLPFPFTLYHNMKGYDTLPRGLVQAQRFTRNQADSMENINDDSISGNVIREVKDETRGNYVFTYAHTVPFFGKAKLKPEDLKLTVSFNGSSHNVTKATIKVKKGTKTGTIKIKKVDGVTGKDLKELKKALKGNDLTFDIVPYVVTNISEVVPKINKKGVLKKVTITIFQKKYKAKNGEYRYDQPTNSIVFEGDNLTGSWRLQS